MIYVDDGFKFPMMLFRGMKMSHLIADDLSELHKFAKKIGLKRSWFQRSHSGDHYDVSMSYRKRAIEAGAHEISMRELSAICWCQRAGVGYSSPWRALYQMMVHFMVDLRGLDAPTKEIRSIARERTRRYRERTNDGGRVSGTEPRVGTVSDKVLRRRVPRRNGSEEDITRHIVCRRPSTAVGNTSDKRISRRHVAQS